MDALLKRYALEPNKVYAPHDPEILSELFRKLSLTYHDRGRFRQEYMDLKAEEILACLAMQLDIALIIHQTYYFSVEFIKKCMSLQKADRCI